MIRMMKMVGCLAMAWVLTIACATPPGEEQPVGLTEEEVARLLELRAQKDPFLRTQTDFGLEVLELSQTAARVRVTNKTGQAQEVSPRFFGVIHPPGRDVKVAAPDSLRTFPVTRVAPGEQVTGVLVFAPGIVKTGARLVFRSAVCEGCQAAMTELQAARP